jgi:hypothetical protein
MTTEEVRGAAYAYACACALVCAWWAGGGGEEAGVREADVRQQWKVWLV